jgi:hypothetical protein
MKTWWSGRIDTQILRRGISWKLVVTFTTLPFYLRRKSPRYPMDIRQGGPQYRSDDMDKRKIMSLPGLELRPIGRLDHSYSLYRLLYRSSATGESHGKIIIRLIDVPSEIVTRDRLNTRQNCYFLRQLAHFICNI